MSVQTRPLMSVAILTWNRRHHVVKAIQSVLEQSYPHVEIVVVDSASSDDTVTTIRSMFPMVRIIKLPSNLGCPEGRNVALANCNGEFIFALDDDGWLHPNTLEVCVDRFVRYPSAGVIAGRILPPGASTIHSETENIHYTFSGGASAIRKALLDRIGYYPSDYFRQGEETDLSLRLYEAGFEVLRCPDAVMFHEASPINRNTKLFWFYGCRNDLYTVLRRYPWSWVLPGLVQQACSWLLLGLRRGAVLHAVAGIAAAIINSPRVMASRQPVSWTTIRRILSIRWQARRHPASRTPPRNENLLNEQHTAGKVKRAA